MIIWNNVLTLLQIAVGYSLLCVYLPSLCLHDLVKEKPLSYRFVFYQVCANVYLILWGFELAFLECFNALALWLALVVLPLAVTAWRKKETFVAHILIAKETVEAIFTGMYGMHTLWYNIALSLRRRCRQIYQRYIKNHITELLGLCLICMLTLVLFGQYHLTHYGFAYGDESVHFYWEQELLHGNAFPDGLYPHGMHFLVAALSAMLGIQLSKASLLFGCFAICLLFCTLYLLLKETFSSKAAILFGVIFFLLTRIFEPAVYWRYQAVLPMEMGLIPYCIMFYAMPRYVYSRDKNDFLLFTLSLGWCIHAHFYTAITAAFTCAVFGIVFLVSSLRKKTFLRVAAGVLLGILLGVLPFGDGYLLGYRSFQAPTNWATSALEPDEEAANTATEEVGQPTASSMSNRFLDKAFWTVKKPVARVLLLCLDIGMLLTALLCIILSKKNRFHYQLLLCWGLSWLIALFASTGINTLIDSERFAVFFGFLSVPLFIFPAQVLHDATALIRIKHKYADIVLVVASLVFFFFMAKDGHVKDDFTVETNIVSEGDITTCYRLMEEYPDRSWTVVSTEADLNLIRYSGYHYEIADLMKNIDVGIGSYHLRLNADKLYVPTKDLFIVVETKIDQYENDRIRRDSHIGADILENRGDPTPELALTKLPDEKTLRNLKTYDYPWRGVIMSKLYYWMEKVKEAYPNEVSVFYQDETVTVYHIHQDEYFPIDLMLDYQSDLR